MTGLNVSGAEEAAGVHPVIIALVRDVGVVAARPSESDPARPSKSPPPKFFLGVELPVLLTNGGDIFEVLEVGPEWQVPRGRGRAGL
jgi:hypothetical protein